MTGINISADGSHCCQGRHEAGLISTVDGDYARSCSSTTILAVAAHTLLEEGRERWVEDEGEGRERRGVSLGSIFLYKGSPLI